MVARPRGRSAEGAKACGTDMEVTEVSSAAHLQPQTLAIPRAVAAGRCPHAGFAISSASVPAAREDSRGQGWGGLLAGLHGQLQTHFCPSKEDSVFLSRCRALPGSLVGGSPERGSGFFRSSPHTHHTPFSDPPLSGSRGGGHSMGPGRGQRRFWPSDPHEKEKFLQNHVSAPLAPHLSSPLLE